MFRRQHDRLLVYAGDVGAHVVGEPRAPLGSAVDGQRRCAHARQLVLHEVLEHDAELVVGERLRRVDAARLLQLHQIDANTLQRSVNQRAERLTRLLGIALCQLTSQRGLDPLDFLVYHVLGGHDEMVYVGV